MGEDGNDGVGTQAAEDRLVTTPPASRAVVVGAGFAGLLAARELADHVDRVTILDRDRLPDGPTARAGIPQGRHLHTLLPGGLEFVVERFPGIVDALLTRGALPVRFGQDLVIHRPEGPSFLAATFRPEPLETGVSYLSMSRGLLEHALRERVRDLPGVDVRDQAAVRGPLAEDAAVRGVVLASGERLVADLVVDATGRPGRSLRWLEGLGFQAPEESVIHCDFAYSSAVLRPSDSELLAGGGMLVHPDPASATPTRGGYLTLVEGGLWLAGLGGRSGDHPPTDPTSWRAFGRTLSSPDWDWLVGTAEIVDGPRSFRFPRSVRRHFERLDRFPPGLLVLGDAFSHVNPVYGHGMSAAAGQVRVLGEVLEDRGRLGLDLAGTAPEFFAGAHEATRASWAMAAGSDFLSAGTTGDFPDDEMENLLRLVELGTMVHADADAASLFVDLFTLRRPWSTLETSPWRDRLTPRSMAAPAR